jgi:hypothetical protein
VQGRPRDVCEQLEGRLHRARQPADAQFVHQYLYESALACAIYDASHAFHGDD